MLSIYKVYHSNDAQLIAIHLFYLNKIEDKINHFCLRIDYVGSRVLNADLILADHMAE